MGFLGLFLIGVGLSMDAFAVAICQGPWYMSKVLAAHSYRKWIFSEDRKWIV